LLTSGR
jgi:hypothetical protein